MKKLMSLIVATVALFSFGFSVRAESSAKTTIKEEQRRLKKLERKLSSDQLYLKTADEMLTGQRDLLQRAKELGLQGLNATIDLTTRTVLVQELMQLQQQLSEIEKTPIRTNKEFDIQLLYPSFSQLLQDLSVALINGEEVDASLTVSKIQRGSDQINIERVGKVFPNLKVIDALKEQIDAERVVLREVLSSLP